MSHYHPDEYDLELSRELERQLDRDMEREPFRAPFRAPTRGLRPRTRYFARMMFRPARDQQADSGVVATRRAS